MAVAIRQMTYAQAINEAIRMEMRRDPRVILLGEDVAGGATVDHLQDDEAWGGVLGVTKGLVQEFGRDRVLDTPITEAGFIGAAVGAGSLMNKLSRRASSKSTAQILIRWALQHELVVIPKSANPQRIVEDADVFDFAISAADMQTLDDFDENLRTCWDPTHAS